jgi:hypothetical protein
MCPATLAIVGGVVPEDWPRSIRVRMLRLLALQDLARVSFPT